MAQGYAGAYNSFIPNHEATGNLVTSFSRNVSDFALNKYVTYQNVDKTTGYFAKMAFEQAARLPQSDLSDFSWGESNDAPTGNWQKELMSWDTYTTNRYAFPFQLGDLFVGQASWNVISQYAAIVAAQAMTGRTLLTYTSLDTSANWINANAANGQWYAYAGTTGGGSTGALYYLGVSGGTTSTTSGLAGVAAGTSNNPLMKKLIIAAVKQMNKYTLGVLKPSQFALVMSPDLALQLAVSEELQDFLKQSPVSYGMVNSGNVDQSIGNGSKWGLADTLYGLPVIVDDTVRITAKKKGTGQTTPAATGSYIWGNSLAIIARPGALNGGPIGSPSFSAIHLFFKEEMTVETMHDVNNRRVDGRVVENYAVKPVSTAGVFFVENALG